MHEAAATARCWPHLNVTQLSGDANSIFARLGGQVGIYYTYTLYWLVATALVVVGGLAPAAAQSVRTTASNQFARSFDLRPRTQSIVLTFRLSYRTDDS